MSVHECLQINQKLVILSFSIRYSYFDLVLAELQYQLFQAIVF